MGTGNSETIGHNTPRTTPKRYQSGVVSNDKILLPLFKIPVLTLKQPFEISQLKHF
jgi:hypothetical protein